MDVISDVLSLLNPSASFSASLTTGGDWAMIFPNSDHQGVKLTAVVRGTCWLLTEGSTQPIELKTGDCYLLSSGMTYRLASDLALEAIDAREVYADAIDGKAVYGSGQETLLIGGRFTFNQNQTSPLLEALPPFIHIRARATKTSTMSWMLERLSEELSSTEAGAALMVEHLAQMLFVQVLRAHLTAGESISTGWLGALTDERIAMALNLMHANPGQKWTLSHLTKATGMSRSAFSSRFKSLVGIGPLDYLLKWRMQLATKALRKNTASLADIAFSLGYQSESAFANAFKRVIGMAPKQYQRHANRAVGES